MKTIILIDQIHYGTMITIVIIDQIHSWTIKAMVIIDQIHSGTMNAIVVINKNVIEIVINFVIDFSDLDFAIRST